MCMCIQGYGRDRTLTSYWIRIRSLTSYWIRIRSSPYWKWIRDRIRVRRNSSPHHRIRIWIRYTRYTRGICWILPGMAER